MIHDVAALETSAHDDDVRRSTGGSMVPRGTEDHQSTITPEAMAVAVAHAERDRETLARLVREGKVRRDAEVGKNVAGAAQFRAEIEQMVRPRVNLAIRPKSKKRRR